MYCSRTESIVDDSRFRVGSLAMVHQTLVQFCLEIPSHAFSKAAMTSDENCTEPSCTAECKLCLLLQHRRLVF